MAGESARSSVAVIGLGSIGSVIAGLLRAAGRHDIVACVKRPIQRLIVEQTPEPVEVPMRVFTDPAEAGPLDWVLLCTKTYQTAATAPWLARLCRAGTRVAVLQNGVGHAERLAPLVGQATIVSTVVYYNGERLAPDHVRFRRAGDHEFAVQDDADGEAFAELLGGTSMRILRSADLTTLAWRKLMINTVANPITALTLQRQAVLRREDVKALCLEILEESAAVARAEGARLAADEAARMLQNLLTYPADAGTSMYFDRLAGRPFEVEELTGAIVAAGEKHGLPTPLNRMALILLRVISEAAGRASPEAAERRPS
jgi:2-dehydropantoate 2-reductase